MSTNTKGLTPNLDNNEKLIQSRSPDATTIAVMSGVTDTNILLSKLLAELTKMNSTLNQIRATIGVINKNGA